MTHVCVIEGCEKRVDVKFALCRDCYKLLPRDHVEAIGRAYFPAVGEGICDPPRGLLRAVNDAVAWIRSVMTPDVKHEYTVDDWERLKNWVRERDAARAARRNNAGHQGET